MPEREEARRHVLRAVRLYRQWREIGLKPPRIVSESMRDLGRAYRIVRENEGKAHNFIKFIVMFADIINIKYIKRGGG